MDTFLCKFLCEGEGQFLHLKNKYNGKQCIGEIKITIWYQWTTAHLILVGTTLSSPFFSCAFSEVWTEWYPASFSDFSHLILMQPPYFFFLYWTFIAGWMMIVILLKDQRNTFVPNVWLHFSYSTISILARCYYVGSTFSPSPSPRWHCAHIATLLFLLTAKTN